MSTLMEKVFRSVLGDSAWEKHVGEEQNYQEDCAKFEAMTNEQLAESASYYLSQMERPKWPRGTPVYDAVMHHNILPELIKRIRD